MDGGDFTPGALSGLVVADFSRVLAGPYATMLLGDLGAEVVKIERPGAGDDTRSWGPPFAPNGQTTYFQSVNRNKRSLSVDLKSAEGVTVARELIARADVLVENFRPGTLDGLGLGYQRLHAENPRLIYCSISGFGSGAGAHLPGYDALLQAVGGLMSVTGDPPGHPTKAGVALVDVITGLHAVYGIMAALRHRDVTGRGQLVEVNLLSSLLSAMVNQSAAWVGAGIVPASTGNDHPSVAPYGLFQAADGPFVIAVGNDH
ncbi:MAG: CoA transferase, partial [Actinomycetes bacterium]